MKYIKGLYVIIRVCIILQKKYLENLLNAGCLKNGVIVTLEKETEVLNSLEIKKKIKYILVKLYTHFVLSRTVLIS